MDFNAVEDFPDDLSPEAASFDAKIESNTWGPVIRPATPAFLTGEAILCHC
ncbi:MULTISPECIES: hypothetical protein [Hyphomonas]|uniref:hypothetical protein n=1 Tax=Hyphomonas TaxID=85 RepID=UPI002358021D|nr:MULTISPECIES: hypothetical protein [Hyphomonas]|tara:strand:- start:268 stop:420 length:153 start_codon:yes stop_codon:yes gene_type:complete